MTEQELLEDRQIFAEAISSAFARFSQAAKPENLRDIQASISLLVRKLDRLESAEASAKRANDEVSIADHT